MAPQEQLGNKSPNDNKETATEKVVVCKTNNMYYAEKAEFEVSEETKQQFYHEEVVYHGWVREPEPGLFDFWRNDAIAGYMREAECCSDKRREKLRNKAIKILNKQIAITFALKEAIEEEGFSDFLGIYEYINKLDDKLINKIYRTTSSSPNAERYRYYVKYLTNETIADYNLYNKFCLVTEITPEQLRELIVVRPGVLDYMKRNWDNYLNVFKMSQKHVEAILQTGRLGFSQSYTKKLVDHFNADTNSYLYKYYDSICEYEKQKRAIKIVSQTKQQSQISDIQAEEEVEKIFEQACLAVEEERHI